MLPTKNLLILFKIYDRDESMHVIPLFSQPHDDSDVCNQFVRKIYSDTLLLYIGNIK